MPRTLTPSRKEYTLAVFRESLRHFPEAPRLPKVALQDTVLHSRARFASGPGSEHVSVTVPKGGLVVSPARPPSAHAFISLFPQGHGHHGDAFQQ